MARRSSVPRFGAVSTRSAPPSCGWAMAVSDEKPRSIRSRAKSVEVLEDDHRRVVARCPCDAATGMRAAAAEVQPPDGRPIARPSGYRSEGEQLVRGHVGLVDAAAGEAPLPLHVER